MTKRFKGKRLIWASVALLWALLGTASMARGAVQIGDDQKHLKLGLLLQGWAAFDPDGAPDPDSWDSDFYLRRLRILLYGQLNEQINFFVETDNPNLGKRGDFSGRTFIQDAWLEYKLGEALQINAGMLLVPFSHHGMQGAVSLHSLDYHGGLIRYPAGSHLVWRDFGVMLRGMVLGQMLEYRLAILNGVRGSVADPRNPNDWPRMTARLTLNLADAEGGAGTGGFFYDGLYLKQTDEGLISTKKIISLGVSADWQKDLNVTLRQTTGELESRADYFALAADVFFDLPLDNAKLLGLSGQANFVMYDHGDRRAYSDGSARRFFATGGAASEYTGYGMMSELGLRYDRYEVVACLDWYEATEADGDSGDLIAIYGGLNYWLSGHSASLKFQFGQTKPNGTSFGTFGQIQAQLLF